MIQHQILSNGLQIVTEYDPNVQTVAMHWAVPAGIATNNKDGLSAILDEFVQRGALGMTAREHNDAIDALGVRKHVACGNEFFFVSGVMLHDKFKEAFALLSGFILKPTLPEEDLLACKQLCLQAISAIDDNPAQLASIALNTFHHPPPFNRTGYGDASVIEHATILELRQEAADRFLPHGSIIAVSGNIQHDEVVCEIEKATRGWKGTPTETENSNPPVRGQHWIHHDSSQVHVGIAMDAPNAIDENSILETIAVNVFGGASSGRLFTQVRQRRSLCYHVSAQYGASRTRSVLKIHAGTTPDRVDETIGVCLEQLAELKNGLSADEFERTVRRMKSRIVMQGESTSSRASSLWADQFALSRPRSLQDKIDEFDAVTLECVNEWLKSRVYGKLTLVTVGPDEITLDNNTLSQY